MIAGDEFYDDDATSGIALDLERDLRECPGSYSKVPGAILFKLKYPENRAPCPECGQVVEFEDEMEGSYYVAHDREPDLNREGDPAFNGAFNRW